jgi:plastocyanin
MRLQAITAATTIVTVAAALGLTACGDDDEDKPTGPKAISIEVTESANGRARLEAPASIPGGLAELRLKNSGMAPHDAQLVRIDGEHAIDEALKALERWLEGAPLPGWIGLHGGVGTTKPGATRASTQVLTEGTYFLFDAEGAERLTAAATARLRVEGGEAGAELPTADARITAEEYTFSTVGLKPGRQTVEFENVGDEPHHVVAAPLKPGKTIEDVKRFIRDEEGAPPVDLEAMEGTQVLDGKREQLAELDLKPGRYALLCFMPDRKGGPPHVANGMVAQASVG